jgi:iron(III) transport system permease protein
VTVRVPRYAAFDAPAIAIGLVALAVAAAMLLPAIYLLLRVSQDFGASIDVMTGSRAISALGNTVMLAGAASLGALGIAVPAAWLTTRTDLPFARLWFVLLSLPLAIPSYVAAMTLVIFLGPRGVLQGWLEPLGVDRLPDIYGFWGAWLALTLFTFPYVLLPVRAALMSMDRSLEEAARSLGKSNLVTFVRVILPQLRPAAVAGALLVALYVLSDFGAVSIMNFPSLSQQIYVQYRGTLDRDAAASLAMLLVMVALVIVVAEGFTRGRARYHAVAAARRPVRIRLGRWKWAGLVYVSTIVGLALVLPIGILGWQVSQGLSQGESVQAIRSASINSAYVAGFAAVVTVAAALPVSYLAVRRPGAFSAIIERVSYSGYALPGIVIALALVFFGANYAPVLYQTLPLLVFAYMVLFLPQALGTTRAGFLQINPRTEEAGRSLGRSPVYVFFRVTLPQLLPGMSAAGALVFLTVIKELPATLLLSPIGFDTLAVQVWSLSSEAYFTRAAFAASVLVLISAVPMVIMAIRERTPA